MNGPTPLNMFDCTYCGRADDGALDLGNLCPVHKELERLNTKAWFDQSDAEMLTLHARSILHATNSIAKMAEKAKERVESETD